MYEWVEYKTSLMATLLLVWWIVTVTVFSKIVWLEWLHASFHQPCVCVMWTFYFTADLTLSPLGPDVLRVDVVTGCFVEINGTEVTTIHSGTVQALMTAGVVLSHNKTEHHLLYDMNTHAVVTINITCYIPCANISLRKFISYKISECLHVVNCFGADQHSWSIWVNYVLRRGKVVQACRGGVVWGVQLNHALLLIVPIYPIIMLLSLTDLQQLWQPLTVLPAHITRN